MDITPKGKLNAKGNGLENGHGSCDCVGIGLIGILTMIMTVSS